MPNDQLRQDNLVPIDYNLTELQEKYAHSILLFNPLSGDRGHLLDDDLFLSECIAPLTQNFLAVTSTTSAARLKNQLKVKTWETPVINSKAFSQRPRLFRLVLSLPCANYDHVVFQSFEEISALLFMLRHPSKRVHLIVTNNLRIDRLKRHPLIGRFFLQAVFNHAASIIVHSQYEVNRVKEIAPRIYPAKIHIKPFHQFSVPRSILSYDKKSNTVLFLGPELPHKKIAPIISLIKADKEKRFRYILCSMGESIHPQTRAFLGSCENVKIISEYLSFDNYYRLFSESTFVILTHDENFEGALSGVFCDAIASGTAVIAREMAPHDEFFKRFGPMGLLVDYTDPGWCKKVLIKDLLSKYSEFQQNMFACRSSCSMAAIRQVFNAVFKTP